MTVGELVILLVITFFIFAGVGAVIGWWVDYEPILGLGLGVILWAIMLCLGVMAISLAPLWNQPI